MRCDRRLLSQYCITLGHYFGWFAEKKNTTANFPRYFSTALGLKISRLFRTVCDYVIKRIFRCLSFFHFPILAHWGVLKHNPIIYSCPINCLSPYNSVYGLWSESHDMLTVMWPQVINSTWQLTLLDPLHLCCSYLEPCGLWRVG